MKGIDMFSKFKTVAATIAHAYALSEVAKRVEDPTTIMLLTED